MIIRCDVPYFTQRPLTMGAIKRDEASKLIPAGLKFTPFLEVFILLTCSVEQLLGSHIALLHTESALVHAPEGNTSHRELQSGKSAASEQKYTFIGVYRTLSIVDSIGIHDGISIEIFITGTQCGRSAKIFTVIYRGTVAYIGF